MGSADLVQKWNRQNEIMLIRVDIFLDGPVDDVGGLLHGVSLFVEDFKLLGIHLLC